MSMSKTSEPDILIQRLESLSLQELLNVRQKVDELIQEKTFFSYQTTVNSPQLPIPSLLATTLKTTVKLKTTAKKKTAKAKTKAKAYQKSQTTLNTKNELEGKDSSLENAMNLVDDWMTDESDYDEKICPEIENALNKNRASF